MPPTMPRTVLDWARSLPTLQPLKDTWIAIRERPTPLEHYAYHGWVDRVGAVWEVTIARNVWVPRGVALATLLHELVHIRVPRSEPSHGVLFRTLLAQTAAEATGLPVSWFTSKDYRRIDRRLSVALVAMDWLGRHPWLTQRPTTAKCAP